MEKLNADKPDVISIHTGTNDIINGINSLNSVKKYKASSPKTKLVFSSILFKKDKKEFQKKAADISSRLKKLLPADTS